MTALVVAALVPFGAAAGPTSPNSPGVLEQIQALRHAQDFSGAVNLSQTELVRDPDNSDILVQLGYAHLALGDLTAAESDFLAALRIAPDYLDATLGIAHVALRQGNRDKALQLAAHVLDSKPNYADAQVLIDLARRSAFPRNLSLSPRDSLTFSAGSVAKAPALSTTRPRAREFVSLSLSQVLGHRNESEATLSMVSIHDNDVSLGFGIRRTERVYGQATQVRLTFERNFRGYRIGGQVALATGASNLPSTEVQLSASRRTIDGMKTTLEGKWALLEAGSIVSLAPSVTVTSDGGVVLTLRLGASISSEVAGATTFVDLRARFPLKNGFTYYAGFAVGEEFDQTDRRKVRNLSAGLSYDISEHLRIALALSTGPYADSRQLRLDLGVTKKF